MFGSFTGNGSCFRSSELSRLLCCAGAAALNHRGIIVDVLLCVVLARWTAWWMAWVCIVLGDSIRVAATAGVPDGGLGHGGLSNFLGYWEDALTVWKQYWKLCRKGILQQLGKIENADGSLGWFRGRGP